MKRVLSVVATAALVGWFIADGRWMLLRDAFARLDVATLLLGIGGLVASYLLRAARVHDEFRRDGPGRFAACLRTVVIHNAAVNLVPMRGGEAAFPLLLRRTFGTPLDRALASLLWFRLQDAFVVALLAAAVVPGLPPVVRLAAVGALLAVAAAIRLWARRMRPGPAPAVGRLARLRDAFATSVDHARFGWLWTIGNWSVKLAAQAWLLAAFLPADVAVGAAGALGAELASILPVQGVAGFGTYEAGAAAATRAHGVAVEDGLNAALALHLVVLGCSVATAAVALLLPGAPLRASAPQPLHPEEPGSP